MTMDCNQLPAGRMRDICTGIDRRTGKPINMPEEMRESYLQYYESGQAAKHTPSQPIQRDLTRPGTVMARFFKKMGISEKSGCACKSHAAKMDRWGAAACRENLDVIAGWMKDEAKARKLPYSEFVTKRLILWAIKQSEREAKAKAKQ